MVDYDVAAGIHRRALDRITKNFWENNPSLFAGKQSSKGDSIYWFTNESPVFDFSPFPPSELPSEPRLRAYVEQAEATSRFKLMCANVQIRVQFRGQPPGEAILITVTATCTLNTNQQTSRVELHIDELTATSTDDPLTDEVIQNDMLPAVKATGNMVLGNIDMPPLEIGGIQLSSPVVVVMADYLVAMSFLLGTSSGAPSTMAGFPQDDEFFLLLSQRATSAAVNAGVDRATDQFKAEGNGSSGNNGFAARYSYSVKLGHPDITIDVLDVSAIVPVTGSASATITAFWVDTGLSYDVFAYPKPRVTLQLKVYGGQLWVTIVKLEEFEVKLTATGNIGEQILSIAAGLVVQPIINLVAPRVTESIGNITFRLLALPDVTVHVGDFQLRCVADQVRISRWGADLWLSGNVQIDVETEQTLSEYGAGEPQASAQLDAEPRIPDLLYRGAATGQRLVGGLYFAGNYLELGQSEITELTDDVLAIKGEFDFDFVIQEQRVEGRGRFHAHLRHESAEDWHVRFKVEGDFTYNFEGKAECVSINGVPTFNAKVDIGYPLAIEARVKPTTGGEGEASYVRIYAKTLSPNVQTLPTAYAKYTVTSEP
jgi:hypothetical protein